MTAADTAATDAPLASLSPDEMRERIARYIDRLADSEVMALGEYVLPPPQTAEPEHEDDPRNPLILTEEESRARLLRGLAQMDAGQGIPLDEYLAQRATRRAARVQG